MKRILMLTAALTAVVLISSCATIWTGPRTRQGVSSSLVDFLYPDGDIPPRFDAETPNLRLPLKVGLAFVPANNSRVEALSEARKSQLLKAVKDAFSGLEYVNSIQIVPDAYMRTSRGFETVEQVARLYGLDIIALVSYNQIAHREATKASIFYWTIAGAYFIKGNRNDVQTFVDAAIFDVDSRKLLFRAPGVDTVQETTTLVNSREQLRKTREESFSSAMVDMTNNLEAELHRFSERIKSDRSVVLTYREGYRGGGGAFGAGSVCALLLLSIVHVWRRRKLQQVNSQEGSELPR